MVLLNRPSDLSVLLPLLVLFLHVQHGFFLLRHTKLWRPHLARLVRMWRQGHLRVSIDPTRFVGIESIPAAVALLQGGSSMGKVCEPCFGFMYACLTVNAVLPKFQPLSYSFMCTNTSLRTDAIHVFITSACCLPSLQVVVQVAGEMPPHAVVSRL